MKNIKALALVSFTVLWVAILFLGSSGKLANAAEKKSYQEEMAERRQKLEVMNFFLKDPKDATLPTAPIAISLFNQAVSYYEKGDYALAKQAAKDSLAQDQSNAFAYELLGDIANNEQDLKEASANYQIAYNLSPNANLKKKIESLTQERAVDKKLSTYKAEHFLIKYHGEEARYDGFELREMLRESYRGVSQDLGYFFKNKVVVLLLDEDEFKAITNTPHWAGGMYDGKIRMPIKKFGFQEADLKALIAHEVTHAFIASLAGPQVPVWLNEGLAQYEENKRRPINLTVWQAAIKTGNIIPLSELFNERVLTSKKDAMWVNLFYQESLHLTSYLIQRHGMFYVKKIITEFSKEQNPEVVIHNVLKIPITRLEKEWLSTIS